MLAVITSYFMLAVLALDPTTWADIQISHLEDWTTIPKFEISIDEKPRSTESQFPVLNYDMKLQNGTTFICSIPNLRSSSEQPETGSEAADWGNLTSDQIRAKMETNFEIALRGKCARKSEGFWSFQVCPYKGARQIHTDGDRDIMSFSLGKFHRSYWVDEHNFVQEFKQGTDGRSCKAIFTCGPRQDGRLPISFIESREPTPLNYVMKLETPTLCTQEHSSTNPHTLLYPLNSKCIFLNKGWWSYEFCHLGYVRQFHTERVKSDSGEAGDRDPPARYQTVTTASFILGRFNGNATDADSVNNQTALVVTGESQAYFSQVFGDGNDCDLTGKKRETEIRFLCNKNIDSARFTSIKETKTCSYLVEIELPSVCSNPAFSKKEMAIHKIECIIQKNAEELKGQSIENAEQGMDTPEAKKSLKNEAEVQSTEDITQQINDAVSEEPSQSEMNVIQREEL